jgi:formamidopyrimidine-DNA glycosylase
MPELPDVLLYLDALRPRIVDRVLRSVSIAGPFLLRTYEPPVEEAKGKVVRELRRLGKRIVWRFDDELFFIFHLMIAGRFRWDDRTAPKRSAKPMGKIGLASFTFDAGTLHLTEAGPKKRASLHIVRGEAALAAFQPGGIDVLQCDRASFADTLRRENHTLKRSLTDPRLFSGIGNAYSDEILHAARLSPVRLTGKLSDDEVGRLFLATRDTLTRWIEVLRLQFGGRFPGGGEITAFRPDFAVHGKFGQACPVCGTKVQRIRYAENETNYCPRCQTEGKLLADRSLSRLLKDDWPRTIEEIEGR